MLGDKKVILISFADSKFSSALERLRIETEPFCFDERHFFTEKDLPEDFFRGFSPKLYRRGFGYWSWKPFLVNKTLKAMKSGDILVYSDCGNRWIENSIGRFQEYLSMLTEGKPIVAFQQQHLEKDWTKGDVFQYICPKTWKHYAVTLQLWGGCFLMMKSSKTVDMVEQWNDIAINHRDLITDRKSKTPNMGTFQECRHDQSVFSLLVKQMPHTEISWEEVDDLDGKWETYGKYPIQARRDHQVSRGSWFINRVLLRPYRYLQGLYLVVFKHFYFKNKMAWSVLIVAIQQAIYLTCHKWGGKTKLSTVCFFSCGGGQEV